METLALRPRSPSEIVDAAFQLLRRDYVSFVTIMGIAYVPYLVVLMLMSNLLGVNPDDASVGGALFVLGSTLASLIWLTVVSAALVVAASDAYTGQRVDVGRALRTVLPRVVGVLGVGLMRTFLAAFGALFFLVPGLYFYTRYVAAPAALIVEHRGALASMARSSELTRGRKWDVLKALALVYIIYMLLIGLFAVAGTALSQVTGIGLLPDLLTSVGTILIYPLPSIVETLLYYDLRIRKEGYDIELMARELGERPVEQPAY
jgi:hypothetical protein